MVVFILFDGQWMSLMIEWFINDSIIYYFTWLMPIFKSGKIHLKLLEFILVSCLTLVLLFYQEDLFSLFLSEVESRQTKFQVPHATWEILTSIALMPCWTWTGATDLFAWLTPSSTDLRRNGHRNLLTPTLPSMSWVGLIFFVLLKFIFEWSYIRF